MSESQLIRMTRGSSFRSQPRRLSQRNLAKDNDSDDHIEVMIDDNLFNKNKTFVENDNRETFMPNFNSDFEEIKNSDDED